MCDSCGAPLRSLWAYGHIPPLNDLQVGNWMALKRCPDCDALWVSVPHEPYAAFEFVTRWPYTETEWQTVHDIDDARTLHEWHNAVIRETWQSLPDAEIANVERWRDRTYRHYNPIDRGPEVTAPTTIHQAADIESIIDSLQ